MSEIPGYDFLADGGGHREEAPDELGGQDPSLNGAMEPEVTSSASEPEQVEDRSGSDEPAARAVPRREPGESLADWETRVRFGR